MGGVMRSRKIMAAGSMVWPLFKLALFWFLFGQAVFVVAPRVGLPAAPFVYVAVAAFAMQAIGVLLTSLMAYGFSWRLCSLAVACLLIGIAITSTLSDIVSFGTDSSAWIFQRVADLAGSGPPHIEVQPLDSMPAKGQAETIPRLVFGNQTQKSKEETGRHGSIADPSSHHQTANSVDVDAQDPIDIVACEQTAHGLRVTLRNTGDRSVRNIRYRMSYHANAEGKQVRPSDEALITEEIPAGTTRTFELRNDSVNGKVYTAFTLLAWEAGPGSVISQQLQ
jgi:hypothetical protein